MENCWDCCPLLKMRNTKKISLLLVGLDNAGKTTAARSLVGGCLDDVIPTVGCTSVSLRHRGVAVSIFDLGGGPQIRAIWKSYFSDVHGVIFVLDASDTSRIDECKQTLEELLKDNRLAGKPVLVLANKQDKIGALDQVDLVEALKLEPLVNQQKCLTLIEECSANQSNKMDPRLLAGYRWLVNQVLKDYDALHSRVEVDRKVEMEKLIARRKALREKFQKQSSFMNGDVKDLPYKNNIIHVSPPPGFIIEDSKASGDHETRVESITRNIKEQFEIYSISESSKSSLKKNNRILPLNGGTREISKRPWSVPHRQDSELSPPNTSHSLPIQGRSAWDLDKELSPFHDSTS